MAGINLTEEELTIIKKYRSANRGEMPTDENNFLKLQATETKNSVLLDCRTDLVNIKDHQIRLTGKVQNHFVEEMKELHFIKKILTRFNYITMGIIFLAGVAIGTQYKGWMPYINGIFDALNLISKGA